MSDISDSVEPLQGDLAERRTQLRPEGSSNPGKDSSMQLSGDLNQKRTQLRQELDYRIYMEIVIDPTATTGYRFQFRKEYLK